MNDKALKIGSHVQHLVSPQPFNPITCIHDPLSSVQHSNCVGCTLANMVSLSKGNHMVSPVMFTTIMVLLRFLCVILTIKTIHNVPQTIPLCNRNNCVCTYYIIIQVHMTH